MNVRDPKNAPRLDSAVAAVARRLESGGVYLGHGTETVQEEAAAIVFHAAGLSHREPVELESRSLTLAQWRQALELADRRIRSRQPLAYLTGEAWFAGLRFSVDKRVIVPRSPFAELIQECFEPWIDANSVARILDLCTGSACIAIACAVNFPRAEVVAADLSSDALEVAKKNVDEHGLADRVQLLKSDLFNSVKGHFDLIVTNPPYVADEEIRELPEEYRHEPNMALSGGRDGLDSVRRILHDAPAFLSPEGLLALEVGDQESLLEQAFPTLPFIWPELLRGGRGIALINRQELTAVAGE